MHILQINDNLYDFKRVLRLVVEKISYRYTLNLPLTKKLQNTGKNENIQY